MTATDLDVLRSVRAFAALDEATLREVAARGEVARVPAGTWIARQGDPADGLWIILAGHTEWTRHVGGVEVHAVTLGPGELFAELILLTGAPYPTSGRALTDTRLLRISPDAFWALLAAHPDVLRGVVQVAAQRSQLHEAASQQQARLIALGGLAAGLAHELNNPASAVVRAAQTLRDLDAARDAAEGGVGAELRDALGAALRTLPDPPDDLTPLARADREDELSARLEDRGVPGAWEVAPALLEVGGDLAWLERALGDVPAGARLPAARWLATRAAARAALDEIERGARRVFALVELMKSHTGMDREPALEPVDVRRGLGEVLALLSGPLAGVSVELDLAPDLPPVPGSAPALNQVWLQLIGNAADALEGRGTLRLGARTQPGRVVVEVVDSGPGIPVAQQGQVFEPYFTTRGVGRTGLGLDLARRVVEGQHRGELRLSSRPGETRFEVCLPLE